MGTEILKGVVGSQAYNLARPDSDTDRLAVHLAPAKNLLGLQQYNTTPDTIHNTNPDFTSHELNKYCQLATKANPTILELLWLPEYETVTEAGQKLIDNRMNFLSTSTVIKAYGGYATSQARTLERTRISRSEHNEQRTIKQGQHALRVAIQAHHLITTGELLLDMAEHRDTITIAGALATTNPTELVKLIDNQIRQLETIKSALPHTADTDAINEMILDVRFEQIRQEHH